MAKKEGWQRGSRGDEIKLNPYRDSTGKVVSQYPAGKPRQLGPMLDEAQSRQPVSKNSGRR